MDTQKALQLCQSSLDQSRSHLVPVDRYALTHLMVNRVELVQENGSLKQENGSLKQEIEALKQENLAYKTKILDLESANV